MNPVSRGSPGRAGFPPTTTLPTRLRGANMEPIAGAGLPLDPSWLITRVRRRRTAPPARPRRTSRCQGSAGRSHPQFGQTEPPPSGWKTGGVRAARFAPGAWQASGKVPGKTRPPVRPCGATLCSPRPGSQSETWPRDASAPAPGLAGCLPPIAWRTPPSRAPARLAGFEPVTTGRLSGVRRGAQAAVNRSQTGCTFH